MVSYHTRPLRPPPSSNQGIGILKIYINNSHIGKLLLSCFQEYECVQRGNFLDILPGRQTPRPIFTRGCQGYRIISNYCQPFLAPGIRDLRRREMDKHPRRLAPVFGVLVIISWLCSTATSPALAGGGRFTPGPNMVSARIRSHIGTLSDGRVGLFGGYLNEGPGYLNTAEIWDPYTNAFFSKTMNYSHYCGGFAKLQDGRYLLAGGCNLGAEIFDPGTDNFIDVGSMFAWRNGACAATLTGGEVLVVGNNYDTVTYGEIFEPGPNNFTKTGNLNTPRAAPVILPTNDGSAYILGGWILTPDLKQVYVEQVEKYDAVNHTFSSIRSSLFPGETGWYVSGEPRGGFPRSIETQKLSDGRYLLMAWKQLAAYSYDFVLFTFDPATETLEKFDTTQTFPPSSVNFGGGNHFPLIDLHARKAYLIGSQSGFYQLFSINLDNRLLDNPSGGYATSHYLTDVGTAATLLASGNLLLAGGYDTSTGHDTNRTTFVAPLRMTSATLELLLLQ
jgi:hypothetical protein